jgi:hypothetical protein
MRKKSLQLSEKNIDILLMITQVGVYAAAGYKMPTWIVGTDNGADNRLPMWTRAAVIEAMSTDKPVRYSQTPG